MSRILLLVLAAAWVLVIGSAVDGGGLDGSFRWVLSLGTDGSRPGLIGAISVGIALVLLGVVLPFSRTAWWVREQEQWLRLGELLIVGPPTGPGDKSEVYTRPVRRRYSVLLMSIGVLFLISETLEADVYGCVCDQLTVSQGRAYYCVMALDGLAGIGLIAVGLATPLLWHRPVLRVWCTRLIVVLCFTAFMAEIVERDSIHRTLIATRDMRAYREGVAAIWISAAATCSFMFTGWIFAERGRPLS